MDIAIDVSHLVKKFKNFTAVDDLNLEVKKGEYMGLLGPNGAGKSTTLKSITGLIRPTSGSIMINGIDALTDRRTAMSTVGTVIETPEFYPEFTPAEGLDYVGSLYGLDKREIEIRSRDVLEEMRMWDWRNKPIKKFSKGMRQRVMIAQAMMSNPEILILDEPTSGLDPRGMIEVRDTLNNLKKRGMTLLISTHMLKEVSEVCTQVTMINQGKTVISGNVSELLRNTSANMSSVHIRTARPFSDSIGNEICRSEHVTSFRNLNDREITFDFNGSDDELVAISDGIYKNDLGLIAMDVSGADLEALYMELTKSEEVNVR